MAVNTAHRSEIESHNFRMRGFGHPPDTMPDVPAMASGRFEIKTAISMARLTAPASSIPSPMTSDSGTPSKSIARIMGTIRFEPCDALMDFRLAAPKLPMSASLPKKTSAPAKNPNAGNPLPAASLMDSNTSSYATADSKTPAPNAMITPSHFLLMATDAPSKPPMASDEVAIRPQTNAMNMTYLSRGEDGSKSMYGRVVVWLPRGEEVIVRGVVDA